MYITTYSKQSQLYFGNITTCIFHFFFMTAKNISISTENVAPTNCEGQRDANPTKCSKKRKIALIFIVPCITIIVHMISYMESTVRYASPKKLGQKRRVCQPQIMLATCGQDSTICMIKKKALSISTSLGFQYN